MKLVDYPVSWVEVDPGSVLVGSDNRAIIFGGIGPRHEVSIGYRFRISAEPIEPSVAEDLIKSTGAEVASESEWELAHSRGLISGGDGSGVEALADSTDDYWGKQCDGRPLVKKGSKPRITRVWRSGNASPSVMAHEKFGGPQNSTKMRLVLRDTPEWSSNPPAIPIRRVGSRVILEEAVISLIVGIVPSFVWAFFNASPGYISEGWLNLVLGGVFIGLFTGIFWRPRQPTWYLESGNMVQGK